MIYEILNQKGKIKKCSSTIVHWKENTDYKESHDRISENRKHYSFKNGYKDIQVHYLKSINEISDEKCRKLFAKMAFDVKYLDSDRIVSLFMENKIPFSEFIYILEEIPKEYRKKIIYNYIKTWFKRRILHA